MHKQKLSTQELQHHTNQLWAFGLNFGLGSLPARIGHHQDKEASGPRSHFYPFRSIAQFARLRTRLPAQCQSRAVRRELCAMRSKQPLWPGQRPVKAAKQSISHGHRWPSGVNRWWTSMDTGHQEMRCFFAGAQAVTTSKIYENRCFVKNYLQIFQSSEKQCKLQ